MDPLFNLIATYPQIILKQMNLLCLWILREVWCLGAKNHGLFAFCHIWLWVTPYLAVDAIYGNPTLPYKELVYYTKSSKYYFAFHTEMPSLKYGTGTIDNNISYIFMSLISWYTRASHQNTTNSLAYISTRINIDVVIRPVFRLWRGAN